MMPTSNDPTDAELEAWEDQQVARTDVIEQAAEVLWESIDNKGILGRLCREDCDYLAQALADAGLLPTEVEWGVLHPDLELVIVTDRVGARITTEHDARAVARRFADGPAVVVTRRTTPWKDAP